MTHIKRVTMHGFKSFAPKTDIIFDKGINVILGPNGSGKSNISDALCFVLGRLSIKSMRAAKASNLLFMGSKVAKPAKEASVELVFDNSSRTFALDVPEVSIKRIVRDNGQGIYKINNDTKTRAEVIETLAQAGIDPYGFNLILQGQIQSIVKMHPEERRKIIEEVAGIAIYESRKEKSLKELEKTDEKLREISAILRERTAFMKNLEREREQASKFKELELTIRRCKASILQRRINEKQKEVDSIQKSIEEKMKQREKIRLQADEAQAKIDKTNERISYINKHIQKSTGLEQEKLHDTITNLNAELEGLRVRKENYENRKLEIEKRISEVQKSIPDYEKELSEMRKRSPMVAKKQEELKKKKGELEKIELERRRVYTLKTELNSMRERLRDKESELQRISVDSDSLIKQIEEYTIELKHKDLESCENALSELKQRLKKIREEREESGNLELENTRTISVAEATLKSATKVKDDIQKIDVCPLCQNKMTAEHVSHVKQDSDRKITDAKKSISEAKASIEEIRKKRENLTNTLNDTEKKITETEREISTHRLIQDKHERMKNLVQYEKILRKEIEALKQKRDETEKKSIDSQRIEESYSSIMREIEEISSRTEEDIDTALSYKERDIEKLREVAKLGKKDIEEIGHEISYINESIESKSEALAQKESEEKELSERFKKLFKERDELQETIQAEAYNVSTLQGNSRQIDEQINYLKIGNARTDAEKQAVEMEIKEYSGVELIQAPLPTIEERLQKAQATIQTIGSINMRALEVYEEVKAEYDRVQEKVNVLDHEKSEIISIIQEIDTKKKKTFMKTFKALSELFSSNFSRLYTKGTASLELENEENIFEGGVDIRIRLAKGKYFDVTSLSGGEQTLVAMALLFAIQEFKPYHFYIFDEIDAALDKRNSERLAALLKKHMQSGQYIVITHNDALIMESNVLYGVSMHDGISKILSLQMKESIGEPVTEEPQPPTNTS